MITIIDYGVGNLGSVANMIKKVGGKSIITANQDEVKKATKIILPGVGSFDNGVAKLREYGLWEVIEDKVLKDKIPFMGICLGMQLLTNGSEEGKLDGFGFVDADVKKFEFENLNLKVPHMGWNIIKHNKSSNLFNEIDSEKRFYFVHSFYVSCNDTNDILTTTNYGYEFVSSFEKDNIIGCQFHPEKSHKFGMQLFKNFVENY